MDEATYLETQQQIQLFAGLLKGLDLDGFLSTLNRGEMLGFVSDPTLYREALQSGKLDLVRDVAEALNRARREVVKAERRFEEISKPRAKRG